MDTIKTEMETRKIVLEVPKKVKDKDIRLLVKRFFAFDIKKYYGKDKNFPMVRVKWRASA